MNLTKTTLFFWRLFLAALLSFLLTPSNSEVYYYFIAWIVLSVVSFIFLDDTKMGKVVEYILSDDFDKKIKPLVKCLIILFSIVVVSTIITQQSFTNNIEFHQIAIYYLIGYLAFIYMFRKTFKFFKICTFNKKE